MKRSCKKNYSKFLCGEVKIARWAEVGIAGKVSTLKSLQMENFSNIFIITERKVYTSLHPETKEFTTNNLICEV